MGLSVSELKGITDGIAASLKEQGLSDSDAFLASAKTPQGRKALADAAGVETSAILELANRADLARIKGIGRVYSDLLEEAGVDTVKELARRSPANLHAKIQEINDAKQLTTRPPSADQVADSIEQAKALPAMLEY